MQNLTSLPQAPCNSATPLPKSFPGSRRRVLHAHIERREWGNPNGEAAFADLSGEEMGDSPTVDTSVTWNHDNANDQYQSEKERKSAQKFPQIGFLQCHCERTCGCKRRPCLKHIAPPRGGPTFVTHTRSALRSNTSDVQAQVSTPPRFTPD